MFKKIQVENHFIELLTATVSHEMRTPLNSMITLLQNLRRYITDPKGIDQLSVI